MSLRTILALFALLLAPAAAAQPFQLEQVASGLTRPVFATHPPGDTRFLHIVEQRSGSTGRIQVLNLMSGAVSEFHTISGVATGSEQGLLGLAFHPDFANNGFFYVNYTDSSGDTVIERYRANNALSVSADAPVPVLGINQPFGNHNGGWMAFGPDGYLYIATGDGGLGNDPGNNGQDITNSLLGKILRLDVDSDDFPGDPGRNYAIPDDPGNPNPFVGKTGDDEIWAYGLRNPWRPSFDRQTGDFYIADVGQGVKEEVNVQPASSGGGENYGWRLREGTIQTPGSAGGAKPPGAIDPIYDYDHGTADFEGFAVTGGYVYRGPIEGLRGRYFFADYSESQLWSLVWDGSDPSTHDGTNFTNLVDHTNDPRFDPAAGTLAGISSFGEDAVGNLYITSFDGSVFRLSPFEQVPSLGWGSLAVLVATMAAIGVATRSRPTPG